MRNRLNNIEKQNFNIRNLKVDTNPQILSTGYQPPSIDFNKLKVGTKTVDDAIFQLSSLKKTNPRLADKETVLRAINNYDVPLMREISEFFYRISGIYSRMIRYMAFMYRYDWMITPYINDDKIKTEKVLDGFHKSLKTLDNFKVKKILGEIALDILKFGVYYGYKVPCKEGIVLQQLPANYCRSRFSQGNKPIIEFNMKFFDEQFRNTALKMKMLKMFPAEFSKGYVLYKKGKLPPEFQGDTSGWYLLDPEQTVKFTANGEIYPAFISVIPLIIDLDEAQGLDRKKTLQRLLKIVIQKMPLDKNGELIFDIDEAQQLHNNAVEMLSRAIGIDVLTTFADVDVADMSDSQASVQTDDLQRVERQVFNEWGGSQMLFNTNGNLALEKSIHNDESTMYNMLLQFEDFLNELLGPYNKNKNRVEYRVQLLTTTVYNYKELSKLYKEQMQVGFSKMLPQIALGQSQSSILANAYFENDILDLVNVFIPPLMSSTMNENILNRVREGDSGEGAGRKKLENDQKSEKTIANEESKS